MTQAEDSPILAPAGRTSAEELAATAGAISRPLGLRGTTFSVMQNTHAKMALSAGSDRFTGYPESSFYNHGFSQMSGAHHQGRGRTHPELS